MCDWISIIDRAPKQTKWTTQKGFFFGLFFCQLSTVLCFFWLKHSLKLIIDNHPSDCRCWTNDEMSFDSRQFHWVVFVSVNYIKRPHTKRKIGKCVLLYSGSLRGPNLSCGEILACLFHLRWVLGNTLWGGKMLLLPLRDIKWQWLPATCWASHSLGASLLAHPQQFCAKSSRFSGGWDLLLFASRVPYVRDDVLTFCLSVQSQDCDLVRLKDNCYTASWLKDLTLSRLINPADIHLGYQSIIKLGSMYLWVYEQNQSGANMQFSMLVREWAPHRHFTSITVWLHVKVWWGSIPVNFPEYQLNLWGNLSPSVHRNRVNEKPLCIKYHVQRCRFLCELLHKVANMPSSFVGYTV